MFCFIKAKKTKHAVLFRAAFLGVFWSHFTLTVHLLALYKLSVDIQSHVNSVSVEIQQKSVDCHYVLLQQVINQYSLTICTTESTSSKLTINYYQFTVNSVMIKSMTLIYS